ncbi:hypothetical protein FQA39_LY00680 [Lamprigera yunnana]|nr:hypothetical protein FQA39_LY00680 [Lamprigera yunnana]
MWMLYAKEHWTKVIDLKSAVGRLYEELGALEFDADHEEMYGMERYHTVQQCEELRVQTFVVNYLIDFQKEKKYVISTLMETYA